MSADYWTSTQRHHWQFSRDLLNTHRKNLRKLEKSMEDSNLISKTPVNYDSYMRIYIHSLINKLGRRLSARQIALSTAEVYLLRFFTKVSLKEINIYLLVTTAVYLACKIEECPQHIRTIVTEARSIWPEYIPHDATKLAEFEFYLIEELDTYLIVHHPYKSLLLINETLSSLQPPKTLSPHGLPVLNNGSYTLTSEELQSSWSIINDSYVTDLPLIYPPHIIATAAIYLTTVLKFNHMQQMQKDNNNITLNNGKVVSFTEGLKNFINFLGYSNIDLESVVEAVQELITLYEIWETYDEAECKKPIESILLKY